MHPDAVRKAGRRVGESMRAAPERAQKQPADGIYWLSMRFPNRNGLAVVPNRVAAVLESLWGESEDAIQRPPSLP